MMNNKKFIIAKFGILILICSYLTYYYSVENENVNYIKVFGSLALSLSFLIALINKLKNTN